MTQNQKGRLIHLFEIGWAPDLVKYVEELMEYSKACGREDAMEDAIEILQSTLHEMKT